MVFFINVCVFELLLVVIMVLVFLLLIGNVWLRCDLIWVSNGLWIGVISVFLLVLNDVLFKLVGLNIGYILEGLIGEVFIWIIILWGLGFGILIFLRDICNLFFEVISVKSCFDLFILVFFVLVIKC